MDQVDTVANSFLVNLNNIFSKISNKISRQETNFGKENSAKEFIFNCIMGVMLGAIVFINVIVIMKRRHNAKRSQLNTKIIEVELMLAREAEIFSGMLRSGNRGDDNEILEMSRRLIAIAEKLSAVQKLALDMERSIFNRF